MGTSSGESPHLLSHCKGSSARARGVRASCHEGGHQAPFKSKHPSTPIREGSQGTPGPTEVTWGRRLVHPECHTPGSPEMDAPRLGKLRQKQQTRFALSCARSQGLNTAIKHPPCSLLPRLLEQLVPPGSVSGGKKAERLGTSRPCPHPLPPRLMPPGCSTGPRLSVPGRPGPQSSGSSPGTGVRRTGLCCRMSCSALPRGTRLLQIPARSATSAGSHPGTGTGRGRAHPGSVSLSIVPTAEGTRLKVEPERARLCAAPGLVGLQGLTGGQAPTAAVGTFQPAPARAAGAETEPCWGRRSPGTAARPRRERLPCSTHPGEMVVPTQGTITEQEGTEITEVSPGGGRLGSRPTGDA